MRHMKRYGISIFTLVSLLSIVFITSSPSANVSGQTTTAAAQAAVNILWQTGTQANDDPAVYTIEYEEENCDAPVGGTLHGAATGSRRDATFGPNNGTDSILPTHLNFDSSSQSSTSSDRCEYTLRVTASLNCDFTVDFDDADDFVNAETVLTVTKEDVNQPSQGTVNIQGTELTSTINSFFEASSNTDIAPSATGRLTYTNTDGDEVAVPAATGEIHARATATDCDAPTRSGGLSISNAEPIGSLSLALLVEPRRGCRPDGDSGELAIDPGRPEVTRRFNFDSDCTYSISATHATSQDITDINSGKSQCEVEAVLYEVNSSGNINTSIATVDSDEIRVDVDESGGFVSRITSHDIVRVVLFISSTCPDVAEISLRYEVLNDTDPSVSRTSIEATIQRTSGSDANCSARPSTVTLRGASDDRTSLDNSQRVSIVLRPLGGRNCDYTIVYPLNVGPLNLVGEPGNNFKTGTGATTSIAIPDAATRSEDGVVNGTWTTSAVSLRNLPNVSFIYQVRRLPISVTVVFPRDAVFTTEDMTRHDINVVGACARFLPIVSRALGDLTGTRRQRALPGSSLIYDPSLRTLTNPNSQAGEALYEIEPVVVVDGVSQPCEIEVVERETPAGCEVTGGDTQSKVFAPGLTEFEFTFEHTCSSTRILPGVDDSDSSIETTPTDRETREFTG